MCGSFSSLFMCLSQWVDRQMLQLIHFCKKQNKRQWSVIIFHLPRYILKCSLQIYKRLIVIQNGIRSWFYFWIIYVWLHFNFHFSGTLLCLFFLGFSSLKSLTHPCPLQDCVRAPSQPLRLPLWVLVQKQNITSFRVNHIPHWASPQGVCDIELLPSLLKKMWPACPPNLTRPQSHNPAAHFPSPPHLPLQHHWPVTIKAKNIYESHLARANPVIAFKASLGQRLDGCVGEDGK